MQFSKTTYSIIREVVSKCVFLWKVTNSNCNLNLFAQFVAVNYNDLFTIADTDNQRVIIHVKDVNDEPPYFINRPLPMQAVVQLNAPPNTPVFTLQARDPDTDHNIHYFIVRDRSKYESNEQLI